MTRFVLKFAIPAVMAGEDSTWELKWVLSKNAYQRFKKVYEKWLTNYKRED